MFSTIEDCLSERADRSVGVKSLPVSAAAG